MAYIQAFMPGIAYMQAFKVYMLKCADQIKISTTPAPSPRANPGHLNFLRSDRSNSRPLRPKWCSNALPYRRILSVKCPS